VGEGSLTAISEKAKRPNGNDEDLIGECIGPSSSAVATQKVVAKEEFFGNSFFFMKGGGDESACRRGSIRAHMSAAWRRDDHPRNVICNVDQAATRPAGKLRSLYGRGEYTGKKGGGAVCFLFGRKGHSKHHSVSSACRGEPSGTWVTFKTGTDGA